MRFTSIDPAAAPFFNLYSYCGGNPAGAYDPDGLYSIGEAWDDYVSVVEEGINIWVRWRNFHENEDYKRGHGDGFGEGMKNGWKELLFPSGPTSTATWDVETMKREFRWEEMNEAEGRYGFAGRCVYMGAVQAGYEDEVRIAMGMPVNPYKYGYGKGYGAAVTAQQYVLALATFGRGMVGRVSPRLAKAAQLHALRHSRRGSIVNPFGSSAPGAWKNVNEGMSPRARAYQRQITGREGQAYIVKGVKFDGYRSGRLLETKGPGYAWAVEENGQFRLSYKGRAEMLEQARRQVGAARGHPIRWHVAESETASAIQKLLRKEFPEIEVVHTPMK